MTPSINDHRNTQLSLPPQIFAVSFFLLLSSCATMEMGAGDESVWDKPESQQERVEVIEPPAAEKQVRYPRPAPERTKTQQAPETVEANMGLLSNLKNKTQPEQVASLPKAPLYKTPTRSPAPPKAEKKDPLNTRKIYPHHALYPPLDVPAAELPQSFLDDLDQESLRESIRRQLYILEGKAPLEQVRLGDLMVTQARLYDTLVEFENLLDAELSPEEFSQEIRERFYVVPVGTGQHHRVLFTGYYTPVIPASRTWSDEYHYPLYRKPSGGESMEASYKRAIHSQRDYGFHLVASTRPLELTREAIDGREVLADKNLEVAWLKDQMEGYFLHIQGSGFLQFEDGQLEAVQYMGSNERPYKSVGRMMINEGIITTGQGSMQGIKRYFREHPEDIPKYLFKNERYIFFGMGGNGPRGSTGAELIGGRAIATDKTLYPGGGLVFITADKPILNSSNKIVDWQPFSRFVLDQDTGSAIKGRGRADLYFGIGEKAGAQAGRFMKRGKMFYLVVK
ncbi:MAG: hypothetical protein G3M70_07755 [Candidatus Nitronauta litoralis]|uniref:peptidoglycan lytic exotransglycosylase n=1 Tax=Candidatus Nitronauta litoralis TaxID=2705533 RepID=A0A7T0BVV5_9BACT|nr:MAG: hypothetical protein G3M70_07755 [Candidatus Nitronauta litoralis]